MTTQSQLEFAKTIAPFVVPLISALVESHLKPKLQEMRRKGKTNSEVESHSFAGKFEEYLIREAERHSFMATIVFQGQRKLLDELYVPLTLSNRGSKREIKIAGYPDELLANSRRILISDTAGMGKSTLTKYLFRVIVESKSAIPILIELRRLNTDHGVLDYLLEQLNPIDGEFDKDFIRHLVKRGDFVFLLDGYDEIAPNDRAAVTTNLQDFMSKSGGNTFLITSRSEGALATFSDFEQFSVKPLEKSEAYELLRKYNEGGTTAEDLINTLESGVLKSVEEFLRNPLLVSLLYRSYAYKPTVPLRKPIFYRQVYDALYDMHDLSKVGTFTRQKASGLDILELHEVLRAFGYMALKMGSVSYSKDGVLRMLTDAKKQCEVSEFKVSDLFRDLTVSVPLLIIDGPEVRWAHKSIMEYFAAEFIHSDARQHQDAILNAIYESKNAHRFFNVLDLCYDIDPKAFRRVLTVRLVEDFFKWLATSYVHEYPGVSADDILERQVAMFGIRIERTADLRNIVLMSQDEERGFLIDGGMPGYIATAIRTDRHGALVFSAGVQSMLCELLLSKGNAVVTATRRIKVEKGHEKSPFPFPPLFKQSNREVLDDDPVAPWNQLEGFSQTTGIILSYLPAVINCDTATEFMKHHLAETQSPITDSMIEGL